MGLNALKSHLDSVGTEKFPLSTQVNSMEVI